jgi:hypothetical protein
LKVASILLTTIRKYAANNINKRVILNLDDREVATSSTSVSVMILNIKEYLQKDLENDEHFYMEDVNTFSARISSMSDVHRREQNIPSKVRIKQIDACWSRRIKCLREMIVECDNINSKRSDVFFKLIDVTKELEAPNLIMDTILLSNN